MSDIKKDLELSLVLTFFFALLVFWLVPTYVDVPSQTGGQLSPAAYPMWISVTGLSISVLMTINAFYTFFQERKTTPKTKKLPFDISDLSGYFTLLMAFVALFVFYFTMEILGMVAGGFILYIAFAILAGEKNWKRLFIVNTVLMVCMYGFFVKVAGVPIPLGILRNLL